MTLVIIGNNIKSLLDADNNFGLNGAILIDFPNYHHSLDYLKSMKHEILNVVILESFKKVRVSNDDEFNSMIKELTDMGAIFYPEQQYTIQKGICLEGDHLLKNWRRFRSLMLKDGSIIPQTIPCNHPGCLSHITHPCEECGRTGGLYQEQLAFINHVHNCSLCHIPTKDFWW